MASNDSDAVNDSDQPASRRPVVGLTTYLQDAAWGVWNARAALLPEDYVSMVVAAGATPVLLPPHGTDPGVLDLLDGLVLTGGADVGPERYGHEPHVRTQAQPWRDEHEFTLLAAARDRGLPVLGICRGLQLIVIAEGGSLHRHLPVDLPEHPATGGEPTRVQAKVDIDSDLAVALGSSTEVTAYHHQGVKDVRGDLRVVARHASGLPLAVEASRGAPVLGVQWHPELDADQAGIFASLITAIRHREAVPEQAAAGLG